MTEGPMSWVTGGDLPDERRVRMMFRGGFLRLDLFDGHLNVRLAPRILRFIPTLRGFANGRIVDLSEIVSIQLSQTKPSIPGFGRGHGIRLDLRSGEVWYFFLPTTDRRAAADMLDAFSSRGVPVRLGEHLKPFFSRPATEYTARPHPARE